MYLSFMVGWRVTPDPQQHQATINQQSCPLPVPLSIIYQVESSHVYFISFWELKPGTVQIYIRMEYLQWWRESRASAVTEVFFKEKLVAEKTRIDLQRIFLRTTLVPALILLSFTSQGNLGFERRAEGVFCLLHAQCSGRSRTVVEVFSKAVD